MYRRRYVILGSTAGDHDAFKPEKSALAPFVLRGARAEAPIFIEHLFEYINVRGFGSRFEYSRISVARLSAGALRLAPQLVRSEAE